MIGIKANGIYWDMKPGATVEIERKSPLFSIGETASETSTPVTFVYSPQNAALSKYYFQFYTERIKQSIAVEFYDGTSFQGQATLIIESAEIDINSIEASSITGYLLFSLSNFYQLVKDKKLSDLRLGGPRDFTFTSANPLDGSNGYWQHFHQTWTDNSIPYVFAPIRNETIYGDDGPDWMNKLGADGNLLFNLEDASPLVPQIRLKYLLTQVFAEHGFTVDFTGLKDTTWEKLLLVNVTKVDWVIITPTGGMPPATFAPSPFIKIDLRKHVPQDKTIFDFINQLFAKYGWAPLFNLQKRACRFVALKEAGKGDTKDWTMYARPQVSTSFNQEAKKWAFTNDIDANDAFPSPPDFTGVLRVPPRLTIQGAPPPMVSMEGRVMYCYDENQWYQAKLDENTNLYEWKPFADNIYNLEPFGATDTIASTISTLPIYFSEYRTNSAGQKRYCYFPLMHHPANKSIGYRTIFYHGLNWELKDNKGAGEILIPYSSSIREQSFGTEPLPWSNVYRHPLFEGSVLEQDFGIVPYWFSYYLSRMVNGEEQTIGLDLPRIELMNFSWNDRILIKQVPYMVMSLTEQIPYKGFVLAKLKRIVQTVLVADGNLRPMYVQLTVINLNPFTAVLDIGFGTVTITGVLCDVKINVYSDAAGTIPYSPVTPFSIMVRSKRTDDGVITLDQADQYLISTQEETIMVNTLLQSNRPTNYHSSIDYSLDDSTTGEYEVI